MFQSENLEAGLGPKWIALFRAVLLLFWFCNYATAAEKTAIAPLSVELTCCHVAVLPLTFLSGFVNLIISRICTRRVLKAIGRREIVQNIN